MLRLVITNPRRVWLLLFILLLVCAGIALKILWGRPVITRGGELIVAEGSSAQAVWQTLVKQDYVNRLLPLRYYGWRLSANHKLQAGTYALTAGEHVRDLITRLVSGGGKAKVLTVTFPEGFTLRQIATRAAAQGVGTADDFIASATPEKFIGPFPFLGALPASRTLEGYLFPDTYQVFADDTPADVILRLLANFEQKFTAGLRDETAAQHRTQDQIVIMASIIEREVISDEDMALVSGILWKRLDNDLGLDADATIRYALQKWDAPLTYQDLQTDSPYNTRQWRGLPPGPISNPGLRAIQAAVRPQESDYYYYLSAPDGRTIFSTTLAEHNINKAKYLR